MNLIGVYGTALAIVKLGWADAPVGAAPLHVLGVALLCGIGFTMSLFIGALAFPNDPLLVDEAKIGVLAGSLLSAIAGYALLRFTSGVETSPEDEDEEAEIFGADDRERRARVRASGRECD